MADGTRGEIKAAGAVVNGDNEVRSLRLTVNNRGSGMALKVKGEEVMSLSKLRCGEQLCGVAGSW